LSDRPIAARFARARANRRAALIPYLTAGYPSAAATREALAMIAEAGADIVELGIPFSDPLADGPVIQRASEAALRAGMSLERALALVRDAGSGVPVVLFSYLNPLLAYGFDAFVRDASAAGVAGLLVTDLPAGQDPERCRLVRDGGLDLIRLVAPTTPGPRVREVVADGSGFVYVIARLGVTGPRTGATDAAAQAVQRVREVTELPVAVGFGIRSAEQVRAIAQFADGVVVGSALVERLGAGVEPARALLTELASGLGRF
jgi:tryptophan synthase alpha chain